MPDVLIDVRDRIGLITVNRPQVLNAWTMRMRETIIEALTDFDDDDNVDAVVLTGAGEKAFSAGQDLGETATYGADDVEGWLDSFKRLYDALLSSPKPVVAALNGVAVGSAFQVAMVCDYRIGHRGVRVGQPEVNSGIPSITGHFLAQYNLGHSRTVDLMLSGRLLDAEEAHAVGLIHQLVPAEEVAAAAAAHAQELAKRPKLAFRLTKQRIRDVLWPGLLDAFRAGLEIDREAWGSGEPQLTAQRFFEQRQSASKVSG